MAVATYRSITGFPEGLDVAQHGIVKPQVLARDGTVLSMTLQNAWNTRDLIPLNAVPSLMQRALIASEDQNFYEHHGVDWSARFAATWQNAKAHSAVRGASTITEQVVRMLHPRPRTLWSRWIEGFEARDLEAHFSKALLLEFYINQVPHSERRRGFVQAARLYYDRSLDTLSPAEMLSLVVLVRSPYGMDLRRDQTRARTAIHQLADRMQDQQQLSADERRMIPDSALALSPAKLSVDAGYFVAHVLETIPNASTGNVRTTLDPYFQSSSQDVLDAALKSLQRRNVHDGALIVIDHSTNEVLAWVVAHTERKSKEPARVLGYDTVLTPRQPGSTVKPFLYGMALERGWTAATLIDDSELSESIGSGVHVFHNYSHVHYGPIRLRDALGNSLNIPAVKTLKFVGGAQFIERLHELGVTSLREHPDFYGDGLALGNGELSLFELAQAYTVFARHGRFLPLTLVQDQSAARTETTVYSPEIASLIASILSDADARQREFGKGLQFPVETAIKTGTSTDYRDAWAVAFDYSHTVAVWMGNLDGTPMDGVTGAVGPAMVLRSVFSTLNRNQETHGLRRSNALQARSICRTTGAPADDRCESTTEWFVRGTQPTTAVQKTRTENYKLVQPTPGLLVAHDPRIPAELEALTMSIEQVPELKEVEWTVDGAPAARTQVGKYSWSLVKGTHEVYARIWTREDETPRVTEAVRFYVK